MRIFASWSQDVGASNQPTEFCNFFHKSRYEPKGAFTGSKANQYLKIDFSKVYPTIPPLIANPLPECQQPNDLF